MNKILSVAVPCYNSEAYMKNCIESLLPGGNDIEIIIVDDGSSDRTAQIADEYAQKYPDICKAVHQENGGHGQAVNTGLNNASGYFFKVVDSDDKVSREGLFKLMQIMKVSIQENKRLDMLISNYVYDKAGVKRKKIMRYTSALPTDRYFTWEDVGNFRKDQYILMHSVIYRTELLRQCGLELPKHTFYVDNIFVFQPLPHVVTMYYADVNFYWYFIGRDDQSVHEDIMIKRIDQQIRVNKLMVDYFKTDEILSKKCRGYMMNYLEIVTTISSVLCIISGTKENMAKKDELWKYIKESNEPVYKILRMRIFGVFMNGKTVFSRTVAKAGYHIAHKVIGFN